MRTDPPSSLPTEPKQRPLATAAAEPADDLALRTLQQSRDLCVGIADVAFRIDCKHTLDHTAEHSLCLGLALAQGVGQIHKIAAHLIHRARQRIDLQRRYRRDGD